MGAERHQDVHHQRRARRPVFRRRQDRPGKREVSMFIVEKGTPGFSVGRALKKTGWLSSDTAELVFDNVRIPAANLLGEEGKGFYSVMKNFQTERIALAAMAVGHCQQALKLTLDYVRQRQAFGGRCGTSRRSASASPCWTPRPAPRASSCTTAPGASRRGTTSCRTSPCSRR
jgi:alkylation response protein AidB-like acyl-CoA dehydrogenase